MQREQKENVRSYFDKTSAEYSRVYDTNNADSLRAYIFLSRKRNVLSLLGKCAGRLLDIGCGPAVFTEELLKNGCEVWGVDISKDMIEQAKNRVKSNRGSDKLHFSVGDIERLDFPDQYFDRVLCVGVLEYLEDDSLALKEIYRVLKSTGEAIFTIPNMLSPFSLMDRIVANTAKVIINILSIVNIKTAMAKDSLLFSNAIKDKYYYPPRFNKKLLKSGFLIDKKIFHTYRLSMLNAVSASLSLSFAKKLEWLSRFPFYWMGINYIVKARKS